MEEKEHGRRGIAQKVWKDVLCVQGAGLFVTGRFLLRNSAGTCGFCVPYASSGGFSSSTFGRSSIERRPKCSRNFLVVP